MNLTLYQKQDENWVEYSDNDRYSTWPAKRPYKKQEVSILTFILQSFIHLQQRFAFANTIIPYNRDILCLTKTWLTGEVPNEALFLQNYDFHRQKWQNIENRSLKTRRSSSGVHHMWRLPNRENEH